MLLAERPFAAVPSARHTCTSFICASSEHGGVGSIDVLLQTRSSEFLDTAVGNYLQIFVVS